MECSADGIFQFVLSLFLFAAQFDLLFSGEKHPCEKRDINCLFACLLYTSVFNVITGERYKMCTNEFKDMVAGKYGTTPMPIDPEFQKKIIGDAPVITGRPADLLEPELDTLRKEMAQWSEQEEDVLSYAMFPKVSLDFFKKRQEKKYGIDGKHADKEKMIHPV